MKITEDVRKYAAEQGIAEEEVLKNGMEEKSKEFVEKPKHHADVYVFALLAHKKENPTEDKKTVNPLELNQWEFYVVPKEALDKYKRSEVSITLNSLKTLTGGAVDYFQLAGKINSFKKH